MLSSQPWSRDVPVTTPEPDKSHRETAALAQAGVVGRPAAEQRSQRVRHLAPLARNVVTAVLVQLERQNGHPGLGRAIPYVTQRLSTTHRPIRAPR